MKIIKNIAFLLLVALLSSQCEKTPPGPEYPYNPTPFELKTPDHFPLVPAVENNPFTEEGIALGRMLYYDPILHADSLKSCGDCHIQSFSFTSDPDVLPHINLAWSNDFLWNGKVKGSVEEIMLFEVEKFFHTDMDRLKNHPDYPRLFFGAFGEEEMTTEQAGKALAQFVRTLVSANSRFDSVMRNEAFFTDQELRGFELFNSERGDCFHCHVYPLFTDNMFHNNGLDAAPDDGLYEISSLPFDLGKFKTPSLRNIEFTGPYMHDGRYETLMDVLDFYSDGVAVNSPTLDPLMNHMGGINMTYEEKVDMLAFLKTLTDHTFVSNPDFSNPFE